MKCGILFSGGKDSTMAAYLTKKKGYELTCLITLISKNKDSYMFHTPSIQKTRQQAKVMKLPLIVDKTKGEKEKELIDLERAIKTAKKKYKIDCIVTGAIRSVYQASRIQKICDRLELECFNPLWHKDEFRYLNEIIERKFKVIVIGVSAYPLNASWLGRKIDKEFIRDVKELNEKYKIHVAGEGGEFETFVLDCPLFERPLKLIDSRISGKNHSWRMEIKVR